MILNKIHKTKKSLGLKPKFGFARAKKALGQNFLKSETTLRKIVEAGEIKKGDVILEIGPGRGALTEKLLPARPPATLQQLRAGNASHSDAGGEKSGLIIAVEKDRELFESLKIKFEKEIKSNTLMLVCGDILKYNINEEILKFFSGPRFSGSLSQPDHSKNLEFPHYKIIANIPYNITGAILKKFLTAKNQPALMVLMVQNEVAKRIMARDKKESLLSISVKAYGEPKMIMKVPARYFSPSPKVDSAVITIKNISRNNFITPPQPSPKGREKPKASPFGGGVEGVNEEKFWEIVKAGFAHKRKKLSSNLKTLQKNGSLASVSNLGDKRAENLTLEDWISLAKA